MVQAKRRLRFPEQTGLSIAIFDTGTVRPTRRTVGVMILHKKGEPLLPGMIPKSSKTNINYTL
jgi:hypothetical protein